MFNRQMTQFIVAVLGMVGLVSATILSLIQVGKAGDYVELLVGGLIATTSLSSAWLFRLNGTSK